MKLTIPTQLSNIPNPSNNPVDYIDVINPSNAQTITKVPLSTQQHTNDTINLANLAYKQWSSKTIKQRCSHLLKAYHHLFDKKEEIARLITLEHGKTLKESMAEVNKALETFEFSIGLPSIYAGSVMDVSQNVKCEESRVPLGVVLSIVPFNFPIMVPFWTLSTAIACGNCIIVKASEKVPLTMDFVFKLLIDVFPTGVINLIHGTKETVNLLIENELVKGVTFVGTTQVAKIITKRCSVLNKRCLALGGAKNFLLALPDCNLEMTAKDVVNSFSGCSGQRCMAASVLLIVGKIDNLVHLIVNEAKKITPGCEEMQMGPVIDQISKDKILSYIKESENCGADVLLDGRDSDNWKDKFNHDGYWIGPTILLHKNKNDKALKDEIFGPVLSIYCCSTESEAIEMENNNPYGNAACVYTNNGGSAERVTKKLSAGMIGVNIGVPVPREPFSFGGFNDSNMGNSDITGASGMNFFTKIRKVTTKWNPPTEQSWLS